MALGDRVKSLAGTDREYLVVGVRPLEKGSVSFDLHDGEGYRASVEFGPAAAAYLNNLGPNGSDNDGVKVRLVQVALYDEPTVHFQVASDVAGGNRSYGAAFNVTDADVFDEVSAMFAESSKPATTGNGWDFSADTQADPGDAEFGVEPIDPWDN